MVSAWANQMVVGQLSTDEKSNEITAVPELLAALDITEKIITEDVDIVLFYPENDKQPK